MVKTPRKPSSPYSIRFTQAEREYLDRASGGTPWADLIRERVFDESLPKKRRRRLKTPVKDHQILASVKGELGRSRLAPNVNQLAKAANSGSLEVSPDTDRALQQACADIRWIRNSLMAALGLNPESSHDS